MNHLAVFPGAMLVAISLAGCSTRARIKGDGVIKTEVRAITDFAALEVEGGYAVTWSSGQPALTISTDRNLLPHIKTSVHSGRLSIESADDLRPTKSIEVTVSSGSLSQAQLTGGVSFKAGKLTGERCTLGATGAVETTMDGSVTNLDASLTGACQLNAKDLRTENATLSLVGASSADVNVTGTLTASITGAGSLTYSGNPKSVDKKITGAGSVQARP